jgi:hypothetical protein
VKLGGSTPSASGSGKVLAKYWQSTDKVLAKYWQSTGKVLAKYWQSTGKVLAKYWQILYTPVHIMVNHKKTGARHDPRSGYG